MAENKAAQAIAEKEEMAALLEARDIRARVALAAEAAARAKSEEKAEKLKLQNMQGNAKTEEESARRQQLKILCREEATAASTPAPHKKTAGSTTLTNTPHPQAIPATPRSTLSHRQHPQYTYETRQNPSQSHTAAQTPPLPLPWPPALRVPN